MQTKKPLGQNPLMLLMALSAPGMGHAIGLGEIHVHSSLNEPLAAEIDIIGATPGDLESLRASMANRETFARFNADKPVFLSSATFKVTQNAAGHAVLEVRSRDSFTEPAVDIVVDVRWNNGAVVRQYSLLLDPAEMSFASRAAEQMRTPATPASIAVATVSKSLPAGGSVPLSAATASGADAPASDAAPSGRKMTRIKIGAKATLRGVAWRAGARTEPDLQRMMVAMFRTNPTAFDANINRLRLGAFIDIPAQEIVAAIPRADARREVGSQMAAWRASKGAITLARLATARAVTATPEAAVAAIPVPIASSAAAAGTPKQATIENLPVTDRPASTVVAAAVNAGGENAALKQRVQTLEKNLSDVQTLIERENDKVLGMQARVAYAEAAAAAVAPNTSAPAGNGGEHSLFAKITGGIAALAGALGILYWRGRRREQPRASIPPSSFVTEPAEVQPAAPAAPSTVVTEIRPPEAPRIIVEETHVPRGATQEDPAGALELDDNEIIDAWISERDKPKPADTEADTVVLEAQPDPAEEEDTVNLAANTADMPGPTLTIKRPAPPHVDPTEILEAISAELERDYENSTRLDYNLIDLDKAEQLSQNPPVPQARPVSKERRTSLADALKQAISREPERHDLKMKLLETYYAQAATNRAAFLETVQQFAVQRERLPDGEWDKISEMGRQIASDTRLFNDGSDDDATKIADFAA